MRAQKGDTLRVHYTLRDMSGEAVESTYGGQSMEFILGEGRLITGFEDGVAGMKPGEIKSITLPCEQAYGPRDDRKVFEFRREQAPRDFDPRVGQVVQLHRPDGSRFPVTVTGITEKGYTMDANHPLSGQSLSFDIELLEIVSRNTDRA